MAEVKKRENGHGKKRRGKRRRSRFFGVSVLFLLAAAAAVVSVMVFFRVENIEVRGQSPYSTAQVADASGVKKGGNLFAVNKAAAAKTVCHSLPYIKTAQIKLRPLSTVIIEVESDTPCGAVKQGAGYLIIDDQLKALETRGDTKGLPVVNGLSTGGAVPGDTLAAENKDAPMALKALFSAANSNKIDVKKINSIDLGNVYELKIRYDSRIDILLGTTSGLEYKLKSAMYIINTQISNHAKGKLDVSRATPDSSDEHKIFFDGQ